MRVTFSSVEEFLAELALDAHLVEEGIVRVTLRYQHVKDAPLVDLSVVAGVVVGGKIVELRHQIGSCFWPPPPKREKTLQKKAREVGGRPGVQHQERHPCFRARGLRPWRS